MVCLLKIYNASPIKVASYFSLRSPQANISWASNITADNVRRDEIVKAMKDAFGSYKKFAWGLDELIYKQGEVGGDNNLGGVSATLVDSLDTLYLMGLKEEFDEALQYLKQDGSSLRNIIEGKQKVLEQRMSLFEFNIRILGGLLSVHDLTGDKDVLMLADSLAEIIIPAFSTSSGVPHGTLCFKNGTYSCEPSNPQAILAEFGTMHLEWATLSERTKNPVYEKYTNHVFKIVSDLAELKETKAPEGLFSCYFDVNSGTFSNGVASFSFYSDSFYEYLIKCWRSLGNLENAERWRSMFDDAMAGMKTNLLRRWKRPHASGEVYEWVTQWPRGDTFDHLACFVPGMLVLGAAEAPTLELAEEYIEIAKNIMRTCVEMYNTPTGLSPDSVSFINNQMKASSKISWQRPESVESLFYLYRITGDEIYREQAWTIFQSMKKYYWKPDIWEGCIDVMQLPPTGDGRMQSFFLAETLKYLYLIYSDSNVMHLDEWVFNTEGHPFKISKSACLRSSCKDGDSRV